MIDFNLPVEKLAHIGPTFARRLNRLEIFTLLDLLYHLPSRYADFSILKQPGEAKLDEIATFTGEIKESQNVYTRYGKRLTQIVISGKAGDSLSAVFFNQPYLLQTLKKGTRVSFSGKVSVFGHRLTLLAPEYEILDEKEKEPALHTGRLVPVYPETSRLSSKWLRSRIAQLLGLMGNSAPDFLPDALKAEHDLIGFSAALCQIHFPRNENEIGEAHRRLAFDELFLFQLLALKRRMEWESHRPSFRLQLTPERLEKIKTSLPFTLTAAQERVLSEILTDLTATKPMNRLLQGDVGSGKTVVAGLAIAQTLENNLNAVLLCPTQILAQQHFLTLGRLLDPLGFSTHLLTGTKKILPKTSDSSPALFVGTHALLSEKLVLPPIGLLVIDEQQHFGVKQRGLLIVKNQSVPHTLSTTATPIPRTICLVLYGDLSLSLLNEMPPGRKKVKTWVVPPFKRQAAYDWMTAKIKNGEKAFIVCPLIEESAHESLKTVKAASAEYERLRQEVFPQFKLGLLHGRLKPPEKEKALNDFRNGELQILVATPVVEVGLDVPDATLMVIEAAERFGLAQLHQLRGRVGRREKQSCCLLFTKHKSGPALKRLKALETLHSGQTLAELDLALRGPGELYGTRQHGLPQLKIASFNDTKLIAQTSLAAKKIVGQLENYPLLLERINRLSPSAVAPN